MSATQPADQKLRVLVTGGSGFVGAAVLQQLRARGHQIIATTTQAQNAQDHDRVEWVQWCATDGTVPEVDWSTIDAVMHLAAPRSLFNFPTSAPDVFDVSIAGTFRLLEQARTHDVQRMVLASTCDVLAEGAGAAQEDDVSYGTSSFYGAAKACAEILMRSYGSVLQTCIVRIFHPYGPHGDRFLINRLFARVHEGQEVTIEEPHGISLNPIWNDELAEGLCRAVESSRSGIYHMAGPDTMSLLDILEVMGDIVGRKPVIRMIDSAGGIRHVGDCERAARELGFRPIVSIRDGLERLSQVICA